MTLDFLGAYTIEKLNDFSWTLGGYAIMILYHFLFLLPIALVYNNLFTDLIKLFIWWKYFAVYLNVYIFYSHWKLTWVKFYVLQFRIPSMGQNTDYGR